MNIFKSLFGSLIGAAIAITIYLFVKPENASSTYWFPVLAGLLIGMPAYMLGGIKRNSMAKLISGGLAAAVTAITLFGVELAPSLLTDNSKGSLASAGRDVSGRKPRETNSSAEETQKNEEDKKTDAESGDATDAGSGKENKEPSSTDQAKKTESDTKSANGSDQKPAPGDRNIAPSEAGIRGATGQTDDTSAKPGNSGNVTLAKLESKRKMDFWMQIVMPGIGILLAFQLARGFGNAPAE